MIPWRRKASRKAPESGDNRDPWIAREAAAYLEGTYRELLEGRRRPVPAWCLLNSLAHGSLADVQRLAAITTSSDRPDAYVARLARHTLLKMTTEGVTLDGLQAQVFVPLELALRARIGDAAAQDATTLRWAVNRELMDGLRPLRQADKGQR